MQPKAADVTPAPVAATSKTLTISEMNVRGQYTGNLDLSYSYGQLLETHQGGVQTPKGIDYIEVKSPQYSTECEAQASGGPAIGFNRYAATADLGNNESWQLGIDVSMTAADAYSSGKYNDRITKVGDFYFTRWITSYCGGEANTATGKLVFDEATQFLDSLTAI